MDLHPSSLGGPGSIPDPVEWDIALIKEELLWYPPREDPAGRVEDHMYEGRAVFSMVVSYVPDTVKKTQTSGFQWD